MWAEQMLRGELSNTQADQPSLTYVDFLIQFGAEDFSALLLRRCQTAASHIVIRGIGANSWFTSICIMG